MPYSEYQRNLIAAAQEYVNLGYKVCFCFHKANVSSFNVFNRTQHPPFDFDGISIVPEKIVCVDVDVPDLSVISHSLPPTWKEQTPHGYHLFYGLPRTINSTLWGPKIKWIPNVDLLTKMPFNWQLKSSYGGTINNSPVWGEHVLSSPTNGYIKLFPDKVMHKHYLTLAPQWLTDALLAP